MDEANKNGLSTQSQTTISTVSWEILPPECWYHIMAVATKAQLFQLAVASQFFNHLIYDNPKLATRLNKYHLKVGYPVFYKTFILEHEGDNNPIDYSAALAAAKPSLYKNKTVEKWFSAAKAGKLSEIKDLFPDLPLSDLLFKKFITLHTTYDQNGHSIFYYLYLQKSKDILNYLYHFIYKKYYGSFPNSLLPSNKILLFQMAVHCQQPQAELENLLKDIPRKKNSAALLQPIIHWNQLTTLIWLHKHGADIHALNKNNENTLHVAARHGAKEVAEWLINQGVDVNKESIHGNTPLAIAVYKNRRYIVCLLLAHGANPNDTWNISDNTLLDKVKNFLKIKNGERYPLLLASLIRTDIFSDKGILQLLLQHGADINPPTKENRPSPLNAAVITHNLKHVQLLVENNAKLEERFLYRTPLQWVILTRKNESIIQYLIDKGADLSAVDFYGNTPLHIAARTSLKYTQLLVAKSVNVNAINASHKTPLHFAKTAEIALTLIEAEADTSCLTGGAKTILESAVNSSHLTTVQFLIEDCHFPIYPATIDEVAIWKNDKSWTAEETAHMTENRKKILALLLKYGADPAHNNTMRVAKLDWVRKFLQDAAVQQQQAKDNGDPVPLLFLGPASMLPKTVHPSIPAPPPLPPSGWKPSWKR